MTNVAQLQPAHPKLTNASKLINPEKCQRAELRIIRVINKTANITNGNMILRRFVDIPDGAYNVNLDGSLSPVEYQHGMKYPDVELVKPPFGTDKMKVYCELTPPVVGQMIRLANEIYQKNGPANGSI